MCSDLRWKLFSLEVIQKKKKKKKRDREKRLCRMCCGKLVISCQYKLCCLGDIQDDTYVIYTVFAVFEEDFFPRTCIIPGSTPCVFLSVSLHSRFARYDPYLLKQAHSATIWRSFQLSSYNSCVRVYHELQKCRDRAGMQKMPKIRLRRAFAIDLPKIKLKTK